MNFRVGGKALLYLVGVFLAIFIIHISTSKVSYMVSSSVVFSTLLIKISIEEGRAVVLNSKTTLVGRRESLGILFTKVMNI